MKTPIWPAKFLQVIGERDRARDIAVRLEQENQHLREILALLGWDLEEVS